MGKKNLKKKKEGVLCSGGGLEKGSSDCSVFFFPVTYIQHDDDGNSFIFGLTFHA